MSKFNIEYKIVKKSEHQTSTTHAKYACPEDQVHLVADVLKDTGLEFLTVRVVKEKVVKPKVEVKK